MEARHGSLDLIRDAGRELPHVPLADAAAICALLADAGPGRYDRAAYAGGWPAMPSKGET